MAPSASGSRPGCRRASFRPRLGFAAFACVLTLKLGAAAPEPPPEARTPITDPAALWAMPSELKTQAHPIRFEGRVSYYDPMWKLFWLQTNDLATYIQLANRAPVLRAGQRVVIEGSIVPDKGLSADTVAVRVLQEDEPIVPLPTAGRINDLATFNTRMVTVDAFVDGQQYIDDDHVRLALIIDDRPAVGWVKPDDPRAITNWEGAFIRLQAMYSARFDPTNTETSIELWIGAQRNLQVTGELADRSHFDGPPVPINELFRLPAGTAAHVRGRVEAHEAGASMTIRDKTGQVQVRSIQQQRVPLGAEVEAVGRVAYEGPRWVLRSAIYRKLPPTLKGSPAPPAANTPLENVDQIRLLGLDEAAQGRPVRIAGLVTWSMPGRDFFFLQDVTGGVRVRFDPAKMEAPALSKYLQVEGVTYAGPFMPAVELRQVKDLGSMMPPAAPHVAYEQAITGKEDGNWVQMRGFIQRTESDGDWRWIYLTTPAGEVVGHLQSPVNFVANPGSLIRVHGVCEATADRDGRLNGVMLRVPFLHSIVIEEDAPKDYYDLPLHSIKGLRQLSGARDMTRVRVAGTVLHARPGHAVYLEEGDAGLELLTRETRPLQPGDVIEAVGILGWEGARIVLREAVYRKTGDGIPPEPLVLRDPARPRPASDARLVRVRAALIDASRQSGFTRLTLQAAGTRFEATLEHDAEAEIVPPLGAGLELTGIYQLVFDDARQTRGFVLHLRSPADLVVVQRPRLWTLQRALVATGILAGCSLLGLAWIALLRRRVRQQTRQIREQLERQARLEAEVQRAARLESLGVLAGGIAHDFNNLLTIVIGNLGLAMLEENLSEKLAHHLREIERGASRARSLTRQLLTFAKGGNPLRVSVALPDVVKEATEITLHGSKVRCEFAFAPDVWPVNADKDQLAQVVQNLVLNAVQAMPAGGLLRVALANETLATGARPALPAGRYVKLAVADSGEGIGPEVLPKIFDPYFSTRSTGSGLGLATVYSIVKKHEGLIDVESTPGRGTTVNVWLPAAEPAKTGELVRPVSTSPFPAPSPAGAAAKKPRVLLMDDEESIRRVAELVMRRMGLEAIAVPDGGAALREFSVAQHNGQPFDLVILDLTIPGGMGGGEVIDLIRKLDASVPAILCSGYSGDPVMANYTSYGFQAMVPKPYEIGQLVRVINRLLGREAPAGKA